MPFCSRGSGVVGSETQGKEGSPGPSSLPALDHSLSLPALYHSLQWRWHLQSQLSTAHSGCKGLRGKGGSTPDAIKGFAGPCTIVSQLLGQTPTG